MVVSFNAWKDEEVELKLCSHLSESTKKNKGSSEGEEFKELSHEHVLVNSTTKFWISRWTREVFLKSSNFCDIGSIKIWSVE